MLFTILAFEHNCHILRSQTAQRLEGGVGRETSVLGFGRDMTWNVEEMGADFCLAFVPVL